MLLRGKHTNLCGLFKYKYAATRRISKITLMHVSPRYRGILRGEIYNALQRNISGDYCVVEIKRNECGRDTPSSGHPTIGNSHIYVNKYDMVRWTIISELCSTRPNDTQGGG
uniref:Uncharacterized protein n=1 Tax=Pararge aegeria TaxID=116150 RepID=S4PXY3_9NEOP